MSKKSKRKSVEASVQAAMINFSNGVEAGKTAAAFNIKTVLNHAADLERAGLTRYSNAIMNELHSELVEMTSPTQKTGEMEPDVGHCAGCENVTASEVFH